MFFCPWHDSEDPSGKLAVPPRIFDSSDLWMLQQFVAGGKVPALVASTSMMRCPHLLSCKKLQLMLKQFVVGKSFCPN
eukprot:7768618-Prorocentrum_lima.AAC.1